MENSYTFEDWENGLVNIEGESISSDKGVKYVLVKLESFNTIDIFKIKKTKKEIFDIEFHALKSELITSFDSKIKNSSMKQEFLEEEKKLCYDLLFNKKLLNCSEKIIYFIPWGIQFDNFIIEHIQFYVEDSIKRGRDFESNFIHSSNSKFKGNLKFPFQVFAHVYFEYYKYLNDFKIEDNNIAEVTLDFSDEELYNKFSYVFINPYSLAFFKELVKTFVTKEQNRMYSYIYFQLLKKEYLSIKEKCTKSQFCEALYSMYNKVIEPESLKKPKNMEHSQVRFLEIHKRYQNKL